ncbi:MAG TPA: prolyl oligopeptidase family serine peptidase [Streptosporangiaceae bacterium]|nr:prolyl oligopeptidase family serine peptidase [Streptosporangiaceae bacterium]
MTDTFPRQQARTKRFSLGAPRSFQVSPDGARVVFLRSKSGTDSATCLWVLDLPAGADGRVSGTERLVADPSVIGGGAEEPEEEKARRERSRESAGGVVAFATDTELTMAAFALAGQVYTASLAPDGPAPRRANAMSPAIDPRPDPTGKRVAYVCNGAVRVTDPHTGIDAALIGPGQAVGDETDSEHVTFGLAEFVAAEEMGRYRGYWWAPDGTAMLVARADNTGVRRLHIADPANPVRPPAEIRYPAAGTANAGVSLLIAGLDGSLVPVDWDAGACPYLVAADWDAAGPLIAVQSRDQRLMRLLAVDADSGQTSLLREDTNPHWVDVVAGVPARTANGHLVWTTIAEGKTRLLVADPAELADGSASPVTPAGMQVRAILSVYGDTVLFTASLDDPTDVGVWAYSSGELTRVLADGPDRAPGVDTAVGAGGTTVFTARSMAETGAVTRVLRPAASGGAGPEVVATIHSLAERPIIGSPRVEFLHAGRRQLRTALLLPSWYEPGSAKLPVLMDPYGGPHLQRVTASADTYLASQWFADQGFAVIVADGRGTPGRGSDWERMVAGDLASPALDDQVDALAAVAEHCERLRTADLDLTKVGIRGWSFGGFLSALAVLRRPDVFHAGIAGAPVTDWRLYDTHYTERYLGHPDDNPGNYDRSSLLDDAAKLSRPLMIIHGLADDNVVVAHTLRLSSALLAAGRPHSVLPLTGVTHMASQEEVAENLLLLQVDFLRSALALGPATAH